MLKSFDKNAKINEIVATLKEEGGVIIKNLSNQDVIDKVNAELRSHFDDKGDDCQSDFNGFNTKRLDSILAISRTSADLIGHEIIMQVADAALKPFCSNYRIGSSTAIEICPGEKAQELHRDDEIYPHRMPGVEFQVAALWALDDFTIENGATQVIPGSHKWHDDDVENAKAKENHYLTIPKNIAESYPENIRQLMGFASYSKILGTYPGSRVAKKIS